MTASGPIPGPVGMSASAPLLGRKQTSVASLKLGPIGALTFLTGPFYSQQKLNKPLFGKAFLAFFERWKSAGHQVHATSPTRRRVRLVRHQRPSHPASNTRDDREAPLSESRTRKEKHQFRKNRK